MQKWAKTWAPIIAGVAMQIAAYAISSLYPDISILILRWVLLFSAFLIFVSIVMFSYGFISSKIENVKKPPLLFVITLIIIGIVFGGFETWLYNKLNPESSIKGLLDIKQSDSENLNDVVFVTHKRAKLDENIDGQPYIDLHLFIFNGSVFTIHFNKNIEGNAIYKGTSLKDKPELKYPDNSDEYFAHGEKDIHIILRQWLPLNIKEKIKGENKPIVDFHLDGVDIFIETVDGLNVNNSRHRLKLPMRFELIPF